MSKHKENKIIADHGEWLEIDVSTKTQPAAVMKVDTVDWVAFRARYKGRVHAKSGGASPTLYVQFKVDRQQRTFHIVIFDVPKGMDLDHINHNTLDNRRENVRICSHKENTMNQSISKSNKSGVTGVMWYKASNKWCAQIQLEGKHVHLGYFVDKLDAVQARHKAENRYFGDFSYRNSLKISNNGG